MLPAVLSFPLQDCGMIGGVDRYRQLFEDFHLAASRQAKRTFRRGVVEEVNPEPERPPQAVLGRPGGVVPVLVPIGKIKKTPGLQVVRFPVVWAYCSCWSTDGLPPAPYGKTAFDQPPARVGFSVHRDHATGNRIVDGLGHSSSAVRQEGSQHPERC